MKFKLIIAFLVFMFSSTLVLANDGIYKIEDLYVQKLSLNEKVVSVKGKIIKISSGIMGKDWIHVQDTSKTVDKNHVIFTAKTGASNVAVGDNVTATGNLKANVDLGAGYFYNVLVENSTFEK